MRAGKQKYAYQEAGDGNFDFTRNEPGFMHGSVLKKWLRADAGYNCRVNNHLTNIIGFGRGILWLFVDVLNIL